jgi:NAD+ synthetase
MVSVGFFREVLPSRQLGVQEPVIHPMRVRSELQDRVLFQGRSANRLTVPRLSLKDFESLLAQRLAAGVPRQQLIAELSEALDQCLQAPFDSERSIRSVSGKKALLLNALRQVMGPQGQGNIALAQINSTVGDLLGNARKMMMYLDAAEKIGLDAVVFPEQSLTGWPLGDLVSFYPQFVEDQMKVLSAMARRTGKTRAYVGFVEPRYEKNINEPGQGRLFFNSMAVLGEGKIESIIRKPLLPNYLEFGEGRQLEPSPVAGAYGPETLRNPQWGRDATPSDGGLNEIHGLRYGASICEDIWADPDTQARPLYRQNPIATLAAQNPDVLLNVSASPSRAHKESSKHAMLSQVAAKWAKPLVYVNAVGGNDDLVYDGTSRVYGPEGKLIARAKGFEEQFLIVNPSRGEGKIYPLVDGTLEPPTVEDVQAFDAQDCQDLARTYHALKLAIRDYFHKNGYQKAVIGISGGIDSAVAATLAVEALGKKNVLGVFMPSQGITQSESGRDAEALCKRLGIPMVVMPIGGVLQAVWDVLTPAFTQLDKLMGGPACHPLTNQNNQARIRALFLRAITNQYSKVLYLGTSDKSEAIIGNGTIAGDMSSDYAVLKDVTKLKLNALARWMNTHTRPGNRIPVNIIEKVPTAELDMKPGTDKVLSDDERYGSSFLLRDEAMFRLLRGVGMEEMLNDLETPPFQAEQQEGLKASEKQIALERFFYHLAKNGIFKWGHLAKGPIIDAKGFTPSELQIPIVSGYNVPWDGLKAETIDIALDPERSIQQKSFPERVTEKLRELGIL